MDAATGRYEAAKARHGGVLQECEHARGEAADESLLGSGGGEEGAVVVSDGRPSKRRLVCKLGSDPDPLGVVEKRVAGEEARPRRRLRGKTPSCEDAVIPDGGGDGVEGGG